MPALTRRLAALGALLFVCLPALAAEADQPWLKPDPAALARWRDMRFGMFIHWGPVSLTAKEIGWSRGGGTPIEVYDNLYKQFNPTAFNADEWVAIAKAAGMKYIILTTKHHDGFCLWDTELTDYNIMNSPFGRDVVKELAAACRKGGIAFGTYYSVCDWHHPDFPLTSPGGSVKREKYDLDAYNKYLLGQIKELLTNYGPLLTIWNDVPQMFQHRGVETMKMGRGLQPDLLFNNRTGDGGDYDTPEQQVGAFSNKRAWESCMTVSAHNAWAWGGAADGVKPLSACITMLVRCAGGDGNCLLNVGPRPDGVIDPAQANRLREVGDWLKTAGESIYGTRGGPWKPTKNLVSTRRDNAVYLHILHSDDGQVELPDLAAKVQSATLLGGATVTCAQQDGKLTLTIPKPAADAVDTVIKLTLDKSAMDLPVQAAAPSMPATASNVYAKQVDEYGPEMAFDGEEGTRWATDGGTKQAWIAVDLGAAKPIGAVRIDEAIAVRVTRFELQYREGEAWKTAFAGEKIGPHYRRSFPAVTAREWRLNILDASDGPTINEIELLEK